jgi:hypothetical protein
VRSSGQHAPEAGVQVGVEDGAQVGAQAAPDLAKGVAFLISPANLVQGKYYESVPGSADFGLSIDVAFALAAAGGADPTLRAITEFIRTGGVTGAGKSTVDDWTGIGTDLADGGSIGKLALLADVTGYDPRAFGGHDLIAALHEVTCARADAGARCADAGNYAGATSVAAQSLGIVAQFRAGANADAAAPIAYLLSLQRPDGSFPGRIPAAEDDRDVDSTAMAAMALRLTPSDRAASQASIRALAWIAAQQKGNGAFPGTTGDSTASTARAIQGLGLRSSTYDTQVAKALTFLAGQQNGDGGFNATGGGQAGSDLSASAEVVGGATGITLAKLRRDVRAAGVTPSPTPSPSAPAPGSGGSLPITGYPIPATIGVALALIAAGAGLLMLSRRRPEMAGEGRAP